MKRYKKCHIVDIVLDSEHQVRPIESFTMTEMNFSRINETSEKFFHICDAKSDSWKVFLFLGIFRRLILGIV